jgi:hypothetical protein
MVIISTSCVCIGNTRPQICVIPETLGAVFPYNGAAKVLLILRIPKTGITFPEPLSQFAPLSRLRRLIFGTPQPSPTFLRRVAG